MADVVAIQGIGAMTPDQARAFRECDAALVAALDAAKSAGVAQGLLVALLHGHAHRETHEMMYPEA
jgi:hypothetical protein